MSVATSNESEPSTSTTTSSFQWSHICRQFEFSEIVSATRNFDESLVIGHGGFGKVYKGQFKHGSTLVSTAIKRLDAKSSQGASEFWAEVEMLSQLRHCHLVSLIGYCNYKTEKILVYEYMPPGTLEDHLHKLGTRLSWCQRLKICIGAARGLDYLHTGTGIEFGIVHRDVKSSNILLDESCAAKVSDFGLSKITPKNQSSTHVSTLVKGTFGYFDPNYFATGKLTRRSDVYSFGVILLEMLCRKRAVDNSLDCGLATWVQDSIKEGRLKNIIDSDISGEISPKCLKQFAQMAESCLANHPKHRPSMAEVILSLESILTLQEKSYKLLQKGGKTMFGRMINKFAFTSDGQNSETDSNCATISSTNGIYAFEETGPWEKTKGIGFGSFMPMTRKQLMLREKYFQQNGGLLLADKMKEDHGFKVFTLEELRKATMDFADNMIIGKGGSSRVYKGILPDQRMVAIKKAKISKEGPIEDFLNNILILGQINHKNVVKLLGCCLESEVPLLTYEFISNGTLYDQIHDKPSGTRRLTWDSRLRIAHESAGALAYLYSRPTMPILHGDVKSSNILLDDNFTPKVSFFDASLTFILDDSEDIEIFAYLDPEFISTGQPSEKSDVYSFGVILAELLTGLKPFDFQRREKYRSLGAYFVQEKWENGLLKIVNGAYFVQEKWENGLLKIVDEQVLEEATDEQLKAACFLACRCVNFYAGNRPSLKQVTEELQRIIEGSHDNYDMRNITSESEHLNIDDVLVTTDSDTSALQ